MKNARYFIMAVVLVVSPMAVFADMIGGTSAEVQAIAEPVLDNILQGFENNDYAGYSRDFDATLKESIPEQKFTQTDQWYDSALGSLVGKEFLGFLRQGDMSVVLWKGKFENSPSDVLIKLVMSKRGETYVVTGLWFQ